MYVPKSVKRNKDQMKRFESFMNTDMGVHMYDDNHFVVHNFDNCSDYNVEISRFKRKWSVCDCPDFVNRCKDKGIECKHIIAVKNFLKNSCLSF